MTKKIAALILIALLFNGFKDARQLNDLAIVSGIGIDKNDDGEYIITTQVLNSQKSDSDTSSSSGSPVIVYTTSAKSVQSALRETVECSPKKLYLAHMELLLLSEEAAKDDIFDTLDFFLRDNEGNNNFRMVITQNTTPQEILQKLSPVESNPVKSIIDSIDSTYEYEGITTDYSLNKNLMMLLNNRKGLITTSITLCDNNEGKNKKNETGDTKNLSDMMENTGKEEKEATGKEDENEASKSVFKVGNLAYYHDRKFVGYLTKNESIVYNLLENKLYNAVETIDEGHDLLVAEIVNSKTSMKPRVENGEYIVDIKLKMNANITETGENVSKKISENTDEYKKKLEDVIKKDVEDAIYNYQTKYNEDIIGYGDLFYKKLNKEYSKIQDEFNKDYFQNIKTNVEVKVEFRNEGGIISDAGKL